MIDSHCCDISAMHLLCRKWSSGWTCDKSGQFSHYNEVIMGEIASQITSLTIVYSAVYSDAVQRKHQTFESLAFVRWIHRWPVISPHKWPVTRKMFPFDNVIMKTKFHVPCIRDFKSIMFIDNKIILFKEWTVTPSTHFKTTRLSKLLICNLFALSDISVFYRGISLVVQGNEMPIKCYPNIL